MGARRAHERDLRGPLVVSPRRGRQEVDPTDPRADGAFGCRWERGALTSGTYEVPSWSPPEEEDKRLIPPIPGLTGRLGVDGSAARSRAGPTRSPRGLPPK